MLDPADVPDVSPSEVVARYLMFSRWIRADQTVRHDAFLPPDDLEFSVTRHLAATQQEIWQIGSQAAAESKRTLHGRADLVANVFIGLKLSIEPDPIPSNPNHAKVINWPTDKSAQMLVAKQIAATPGLQYIPRPEFLSPKGERTSRTSASEFHSRSSSGHQLPQPASAATSVWARIFATIKALFKRRR